VSDELDHRLQTALDRVPASDVWDEANRPGRPEHPLRTDLRDHAAF
jgi:hypothetical protein